MPTSTDGKLFSNIAATTAAFYLKGGRYVIMATATFGGGNVQLQALGPDGTNFVAPKDIGGSANNLTAAGSQTVDLPSGQYRFLIATATAVFCSVFGVPS